MTDTAPQETSSRYQVITKLGQGGMAVVLLVLARGRAGVNKLLVVKELLPELKGDPEFLAMFLDEARLAVRLNHPNVIQTYEVDDEKKHPAIVMEYLEGQPLSALLNRIGRDKMPLGLHLYLLAQAAAGLHYAHDLCDFDGTPLGVVHRDISPHNLFVTYDGQVKVVDFGIAKVANSARKTAFGVFKGKVNYAAAEQILGETVDRRSDVFALGILLWEALARQRLSFREPEVEVMQRRIQGLDPRILSVAPETPEDLARVCDQAMARAAADRFDSAESFRMAIETYLESSKRVGARELGELIRSAFAEERAAIRHQIDSRVKELATTDSPVAAELDAEGPGEISSRSKVEGRSEISSRSKVEGISEISSKSKVGGGSEISSRSTSARLSMASETELTHAGQLAPPRRRPFVLGLAAVSALLVGLGLLSRQGRNGGEASAQASPSASTMVAGGAPSSAASSVTISIAVTPPDARLTLDGVAVATNPFRATMPRDLQSHRVSAASPGFVADEQLVVFDHDMAVQLTLRPLPTAATSAAVAAAPDRRPYRPEGARPAQPSREPTAAQPPTAPTPGEALTGAAQKKPRPIDDTF